MVTCQSEPPGAVSFTIPDNGASLTTIEIAEPATLITDYILAIVVFVLGVLLVRARHSSSGRSTMLWSIAFLTAAAAAGAGGTYHGFAPYFSGSVRRSLWGVVVALISVSAGFTTSAVVSQSEMTNGQKRWLRAGILLTVVGLVIQRSRLSPAVNFNHNDLYHCIQTVAFYLLFRAAR
jgi:hypothetical protein